MFVILTRSEEVVWGCRRAISSSCEIECGQIDLHRAFWIIHCLVWIEPRSAD